jgi:nucleotide-binding universal stress UspA family protein
MKIIMAVDGSRSSLATTGMLHALRLPSRTEVGIVTVIPEPTFLGGLTLATLWHGSPTGEKLRESQDQAASEVLKQAASQLKDANLKMKTTVLRGKPDIQIIGHAQKTHANLIMIGAKGTGNAKRFPLGGVAQKILKYADCSVLIVKKEVCQLDRTLLAIDGSPFSNEAARFLRILPLPETSEIHLVSVLQSHSAALLTMPSLDLGYNRRLLAEIQAVEEKEAMHLLKKTELPLQTRSHFVKSTIRRGDPASEILTASECLNVQLIALGTKGLSCVEGYRLGSVAQRVARFANQSVLIVRSHKHQLWGSIHDS